ncbi:hypothetical protein FACS1894147_02130 [Spirochaetia bacterium]|nr:hypothetical protein FACS1894147_02130 [Spirochaetia bacterium]
MKKRIVMAMILGVSLSVGAAFAQHPGGLGIGVVAQYGGSWDDWGPSRFSGLAVSLKLPSIPIFWGINLDFFQSDWFGISATGDKYIFDNPLVQAINLGWYLGLGGYGSVGFSTGSADNLRIGAGVRAPVGLTWNYKQKVEVFLDIAPSIGIRLGIGDDYGEKPKESPLGLDGGLAGDFGVRLWL